MLLELLVDPHTYVSLLTLTLLEIVLGIDNIIFISILSTRLPREQQAKARSLGLLFALGTRILLLLLIAWIAGLVRPLFSVFDFDISGRDLVLLSGGLFLIAKSTIEIHQKLEGQGDLPNQARNGPGFWHTVVQIVLIDIVFSFDSVITAVGLVNEVPIMVAAIVISMGVMLWASGWISEFIEEHPTIKILALSFLLMIGTLLVAEGLHFHVPRGYVYFAMAFSLFVELLNLRVRRDVSAASESRQMPTRE